MRNNIRVAKVTSRREIKRRLLVGCPGKTQVSGELLDWIEEHVEGFVSVIIEENRDTKGKRVI